MKDKTPLTPEEWMCILVSVPGLLGTLVLLWSLAVAVSP